MPRMIAPGVYVLDTVNTPVFAQSRARKYVDQYTDQRYENWQTSLEAAKVEYKGEMDAYTAEMKALQDSLRGIDKQIADAKNDLDSMRKEYLTIEDREQTINTGRQQSANLFNVGQANAAERSRYYQEGKGSSNRPGSMSQADWDASTKGYAGYNTADILGTDKTLGHVEASLNYLGERDADTTNRANADALRARMEATGKSLEDIKAEAAAAGPETLRKYEATLPYLLKTDTSAGGPSVSGAGATRVNYDKTQEARDALMSGKQDALDALIAERARLQARSPTAPKGDLIGRAQDIYGERFEALPNYQKRKQLEQVSQILEAYVQRRLLELPKDATTQQIADARRQAALDAITLIRGGKLTPKTTPSPEASKGSTSSSANNLSSDTIDLTEPIVDDSRGPSVEAKTVELYMPDGSKVMWNPGTKEYSGVDKNGKTFTYKEGSPEAKLIEDNASMEEPGDPSAGRQVTFKDGDYQWTWTEGTDTYQVVSGPDNVGKVFGKGTKAYDILVPMKDKAVKETPPPKVKTPQEEIIEKSKANEVDPTIFKEPEVTKQSLRQGMLTLAGVSPELATEVTKTEPKAPKLKDLAATTEMKVPEPTPQDKKLGEGIKDIVDGIKLAKQTRKMERLAANTPYGSYVNELYTANSKLDKPKSAKELREEIIKQYKDDPTVAQQATRYMFARFLADSQ